MNIALDAMGGDNAPKAIIAGAVQALEELPEQVTITLVGDEAQINAELKALGCETPRFSIVHTTEVVTMDDPPTAEKTELLAVERGVLPLQSERGVFPSVADPAIGG